MLGYLELLVVGSALWRLWDHPASWLWWTLVALTVVGLWIADTAKNVLVRGTEDAYMTQDDKRRWVMIVGPLHLILQVLGIALGVYGHAIA